MIKPTGVCHRIDLDPSLGLRPRDIALGRDVADISRWIDLHVCVRTRVKADPEAEGICLLIRLRATML